MNYLLSLLSILLLIPVLYLGVGQVRGVGPSFSNLRQIYLGNRFMHYMEAGDYEKAFEWWRAAAGLGLPEAQYSVGWCYFEGRGVKQDYEEALKWYRLAAEKGNGDAIAALSELGEEI